MSTSNFRAVLVLASAPLACSAGGPGPVGTANHGNAWLSYALTLDTGSLDEDCYAHMLWKQAASHGICLEPPSAPVVNVEYNGLVVYLDAESGVATIGVAQIDSLACPYPPRDGGPAQCQSVRVDLKGNREDVGIRLWRGFVDLVSRLPSPSSTSRWPKCTHPGHRAPLGTFAEDERHCVLVEFDE